MALLLTSAPSQARYVPAEQPAGPLQLHLEQASALAGRGSIIWSLM
jgi:hypothetical protein